MSLFLHDSLLPRDDRRLCPRGAAELIDSTSFGTLLIPIWLMLAPGTVRVACIDGWMTRNFTNSLSWVVGIIGVVIMVNTGQGAFGS